MNQWLIITGGSRGIGKSTVAFFQKNDWHVLNISRQPCELPKVINFSIDLGKPRWQDHQAQPLKKTIEHADQICLVHNAAFYGKDSIDNFAVEDCRKMLEIAIIAPAILNQIFLPHMKPGSSIIYLGSTLSDKAVKGSASYVISKHAVKGMMKSTCQDLEGSGIHTACICPGFTDTEMLRTHVSKAPAVLEALKNMNAAKRLVSPVEIAETIFFGATHPVLNGAVLHANLGQIEH
jgi:3-oxoacyl-[acyl-carrier protein] reductase